MASWRNIDRADLCEHVETFSWGFPWVSTVAVANEQMASYPTVASNFPGEVTVNPYLIIVQSTTSIKKMQKFRFKIEEMW